MLIDEEPLYQGCEDRFRSPSLTQLSPKAAWISGTKGFHLLSLIDVGLTLDVGNHYFTTFSSVPEGA